MYIIPQVLHFQLELAIALNEVNKTNAKLPLKLRKKSIHLPVIFRSYPSKELIKEGIEKDTLGLFVGPPFVEEDETRDGIPSHIYIFVSNLKKNQTTTKLNSENKSVLHTYMN